MSARRKAIASGRISDVSIEAGYHVARLANAAVAALEAQGEPDARCKTCAFSHGTVPNHCADTLSDAIKCVVEAEPFYCHVHVGNVCHGWYASRVATKGAAVKAPWPFSHEEQAAQPQGGAQ